MDNATLIKAMGNIFNVLFYRISFPIPTSYNTPTWDEV